MIVSKIKAFLSRARATLPGRWLWLLIGLGLIANGQYLMHQREPAGRIKEALDTLNITFRLDIVNMQNFGAAIPFLLAGGLLSALVFLPDWNKGEEIQATIRKKVEQNWAYLLPRLAVAVLLFAYLIFKLARHDYNPILPWLWIFVLALLTYLLYKYEKSTGAHLSPNITCVDIFWMIGLFLLGLGIGSFALQDIPKIMVPDEGSFWETGRAIAIGEFKPAFFDFGVYTFPVASSIFQGWVMRLFGVNLWGWRFASVLAGSLTIIPFYLLAREWFDRRVAIVAALIMISSPYYLSFARMGYNNSQALFPVVLSLYFWSLGYRRNSTLYYWLAGLASGLGFYTYTAAWLGPVTIIIVMTLLTTIRRIIVRWALLTTAVFLLAIAITAGPRLVYGASSQNAEPLFYKLVETSFINSFHGSAFYGPAELYPEGVAYLLGDNQIFYAPEVYAELLTRGIVRTLAALFNPFIVTEHFLTNNFAGGFLAAIGLALGLGLSLRTLKQTRSILLLTWLGAGLFFLSIIAAFPPRHTHLVTVIPVLALFSAIGFAVGIDTLLSGLHKKWKSSLVNRGSIGLLALISVALVFFGLKEYFTIMPTRNPPLFEDIAAWVAWRTKEPHTIVYIGPTDIRHRVQYQVDTHMATHEYISVTREDFKWENLPLKSIVFFEGQAEGKGTPLPEPPIAFTNMAIYTNPAGIVVGYARADTNVELQPLPYSVGLRKILVSTVFGITFLGILAFLVRGKIKLEKNENRKGFRLMIEIRLRESPKEDDLS